MNSFKKVLLSTTIALLLGLFTAGTVYADELKTGSVTASVLNVRSGPGLSNKVIDKVKRGETLQIISSSNKWYKVTGSGVSTGWVSKSYIKEAMSNVSRAVSLSSRGSSYLSLRSKFVDYAKTFLGVPYLWGGTTAKGFDCSGFVQHVYSHFGYSIKRVSYHQVTEGTPVSKSQLQPGDLVFFDTNFTASNINHVGMFIGEGQFIHASSSKGITITSLSNSYYIKAYMTARRILK